MSRLETPVREVRDINPGSFTQNANYSVWRPHGSNDWLLLYTLEGAGLITSDGNSKQVADGDIILFEPGAPQDYRTDPHTGTWSLLWVHFLARPHWQRWFSEWPVLHRGIRWIHLPPGDVRSRFQSSFEESLASYHSSLAHHQAFAMNALEKALIWIRTLLARDPWAELDDRIRMAMTLMEKSIETPAPLAALARSCNLSVSRFAHLFREQTGLTPQQYQENLRMAKAQQLLENTSLRIGEVAREVGYEDPFYFSNRFKKRFHKSPSAYRDSFR